MSAPTYDLTRSFSPDQVSRTSPAWCLAIWRLDYPVSFDRDSFKSVPKASVADGALLRGKNPLLIVGDCASVNISASKSSHTHPISAILHNNPDINYLTEILPGDWIGLWMMNYEEDLSNLLDKLRKGDPANDYNSGFKGLGRVDSVFRTDDIVGDDEKITGFELNATCFSELDTEIFYEQGLAEAAKDDISTWMAKIGLDLSELFFVDKKTSVLEDNVHKIVPALFEILLGKGASDQINPGGSDLVNYVGALTNNNLNIQSNAQKAAPYAYLVPAAVGKTINRKSRGGIKDKVMAYADIFEFIYGRQEYHQEGADNPATRFYPSIDTSKSDDTYRFTGRIMLGAYLPVQIGFVNTPLWQIASQFLNPVVNEMYTCFRANIDGFINPTVVLRQIPFTTDHFPDHALPAPYDVTRFLELPRWIVKPSLIKKRKVGRSNATRTNFVHIYGQAQLHAGVPIPQQMAENHPISDPIDIQRSGLRPFMTSIGCETVNQANGQPTHWMQLVADRMMGNHLTLNGSLTTVGIQEPIVPGDNIQMGLEVYHIEAVTHSCGMSGDRKHFITTFALSNGMAVDPDASRAVRGPSEKDRQNAEASPDFNKSPDSSLYAGITEDALRSDEPGLYSDSRFNTTVDDSSQTPPDDDSHDSPPTGRPINSVPGGSNRGR